MRQLPWLCAILPEREDNDAVVALARSAVEAGVPWLQYRAKTLDVSVQAEQLRALKKFLPPEVLLVVNDNADLAVELGLDGAHLGVQDGDLARTAKKLGPDRLLGATCGGSLERARAALQAGASYLSFGRLFPSRLKPKAPPLAIDALSDLVQQVRQISPTCPLLAIGGIRGENAEQAWSTSVNAIAVSGGVFDFAAEDMPAAISALHPDAQS